MAQCHPAFRLLTRQRAWEQYIVFQTDVIHQVINQFINAVIHRFPGGAGFWRRCDVIGSVFDHFQQFARFIVLAFHYADWPHCLAAHALFDHMYGQKCALIEAKELGGTCVNVGCVPKKVMWHAAQIREAIHMYGPDYGFDTTINKFNWETLIASRTAYIDRIHTSYENVLGKNNVDVIKGFARFVDAKTLEVNGETITADHILIATGGRPSHPDIPGVEYGIDSDGFFALPALPERVAVVGAGYIAVELAGVINGLGAKTHLFVRKHAPLRSFDPMISETLVEVMNAEGPQLHTNAIPKAVVKNADGLSLIHI